MLEFKPECGSWIGTACEKAVQMARSQNQPVKFEFNGIEVVANPNDDPESIHSIWNEKQEERTAKYHASDEYKEQQNKRRQEVTAKQEIVDRLVRIVGRIHSEEEWMKWAAKLAGSADDCEVKLNNDELFIELKRHGWVPNANVSEDPKIRAELATNKTMMAEYIMGQVMSFLSKGMPPHPMTMTFVDKYNSI